MSIPIQSEPLIDKWDLYYHLPYDKNWDKSSYKIIMGDIDSIDKLVSINEALPDSVVKHCMLFLMRKGIAPMWEDPKNRNGGCFSFKVLNKQVHQIWRQLMYAICGETLCEDREISKHVNGITISPKKNFCIVKVWIENRNFQDPNVLINIPNLSKQGCLFKNHEPEF